MRANSAAAVLLLLACSAAATAEAGGGPAVAAMFVFGDSLVDAGNNNGLVTLAKADYSPYGVDFPSGATGRFCNGGTVADHLGELLGLPLIPPYNGRFSVGSSPFCGVNYASAGSGILGDSGKLFGALFPMERQIQNFQRTVEEMRARMGESTEEFLSRSLFLICAGSNDYINNYLLPLSDKPKAYSGAAYAKLLVRRFGIQLESLYWSGGRRFLIAGLGPLGCMPSQIGAGNSSGCVDATNRLAQLFNANLRSILRRLNDSLRDARFLYWDTYSTSSDVINNFSLYGFRYPHLACCGVGRERGKFACPPLLPLECGNRSEFIFWDPFHPTDAFNAIAARRAFDGRLQRRSPMNVRELVQLPLRHQ
ncbi:GDSL esterase/lipase At1g71691-like [Wolffia australiana]